MNGVIEEKCVISIPCHVTTIRGDPGRGTEILTSMHYRWDTTVAVISIPCIVNGVIE